jgi:hypothetical protein
MSQSLGLETNKSGEVALYPNPFTNELTFTTGNSIKEIQLKDASGRLVGSYPANTSTTLYLDHLEAGIYHAVFTTNGESFSRKVIKQ